MLQGGVILQGFAAFCRIAADAVVLQGTHTAMGVTAWAVEPMAQAWQAPLTNEELMNTSMPDSGEKY